MADNHPHIDKINEILEEISDKATFADGAMKQFLALKDEVEDQERTIKYLRKDNDQRGDEIEKLNTERKCLTNEVAMLKDQIHQMQERERELWGREAKITELEQAVNYERQRVEDHQNMVGLVFRNTEVKRSVLGTELHYNPGHPEGRDQYGNVIYEKPAGLEPHDAKKVETETKE